MITNHKGSRFIAQAYLAFADYYYGKNEIQNAVRLYQKVTEFKDSPVYAYALYKLAWCHLNPIGTAEARYDKSLNYFVATIKATINYEKSLDTLPTTGVYIKLGKLSEKQKDLQSAIEFYQKAVELDNGQTSAPLFRMAWVYQKQGEKEKGLDLLKQALEIEPDNMYILIKL